MGIPAFLRASKVRGRFSGTVPSTIKRLVKSILPPRRVEIRGITMSLTKESTIFPKAPPMMTPTARSITLPRTANALNSFISLDATVFSWNFCGLSHFWPKLSGYLAFYLKIESYCNSPFRTPYLT